MNRALAKLRLAAWQRELERRRKILSATPLHHPRRTRRVNRVLQARTKIKEFATWLALHPAPPTLRALALAEARRCVGIMEHGGNNQGDAVLRIIRENGGTGPEAWCGDFVAHCYRTARSQSVSRSWASVRLLGMLKDQKKIPLSEAKPGDILVYKFDHTGLKDSPARPAGITPAVEGNTGATGATSDSATGGDGVYAKDRANELVAYAVRVLR